MDLPSTHAIMLIEALVTCNEELIALAQGLQSRAEVRRVTQNIEFRRYHTGPVIEGYVDAELNSDRAIAWWFEVHWDRDVWNIESRIIVNHDHGQDTLTAWPDRTADTLEGCIDHLAAVASDLVRSVDTLEFAHL